MGKIKDLLMNQTSGIPECIEVYVNIKIDWGF